MASERCRCAAVAGKSAFDPFTGGSPPGLNILGQRGNRKESGSDVVVNRGAAGGLR